MVLVGVIEMMNLQLAWQFVGKTVTLESRVKIDLDGRGLSWLELKALVADLEGLESLKDEIGGQFAAASDSK